MELNKYPSKKLKTLQHAVKLAIYHAVGLNQGVALNHLTEFELEIEAAIRDAKFEEDQLPFSKSENTTMVKIDKEDRDILTRECLEGHMRVEYFTMEENDNMLLARIGDNMPATMYQLGVNVGLRKSERMLD
jgi:hypothetical protein